ncbi:MAG: glycosyltransferase [Nitrospirota bacterium]
MHKVSIVLPTYNEKDNIVDLIRAIQKSFNNDVEIIVVDDDSPDKTWEVVGKIANEDIRLLRRLDQKCLTTAISDGITLSKGAYVGWMDCDFSMPPEALPKMTKALDEYDVAIGSRYITGGKDARNTPVGIIGSILINYFAKYLLDSSITDYTTGFVVAKKKVVEDIGLKGDYGEYCIDFLYKALKKGYKIKELPYHCIPRKFGESKTAPTLSKYLQRGTKYIQTILRLKFQRT